MGPTDFNRTLDLVLATQRGDSVARDELFDRYLPRVRELVARRLGKTLSRFTEIDDVVHEALLYAWRKIDDFEARDESGFAHWMARIAENKIRDFCRRQKLRDFAPIAARESTTAEGAPPPAAEQTTPSRAAYGHEVWEVLAKALEELSPRYREIYLMREIRGLSFEEIARELNYGRTKTASDKLACARRDLRKLLAKYEPPAPGEAAEGESAAESP